MPSLDNSRERKGIKVGSIYQLLQELEERKKCLKFTGQNSSWKEVQQKINQLINLIKKIFEKRVMDSNPDPTKWNLAISVKPGE